MPPRYAYWTILIGDEPTAFRAGAMEDIMPTFNRLKEKQPTAVLKWFQNGRLWTSRIEAREAMALRGEKGKRSDPRRQPGAPARGWTGKPAIADQGDKPEWKPKSNVRPEWKPRSEEKPAWKPKGSPGEASETPAWKPKGKSFSGDARPAWKPKREDPSRTTKPQWQSRPQGKKPVWRPNDEGVSRGARPEWKPKGATRTEWKPKTSPRPDWKPKSAERPAWKPKSADRPEWKPKISARPAADVPTGRPDVRDKKWRPGGDHKDPRQKYKDAKKAKWTRFKQAIRARTGHKKKPGGDS